MRAGNWPLIRKLGHNVEIYLGRIFDICPSFCVTWLWSWQKRHLRRVDHQSRTGLIYLFLACKILLLNVSLGGGERRTMQWLQKRSCVCCVGVAVHVCNVQLPRTQGRSHRDAAAGRLHCRFLWTTRRWAAICHWKMWQQCLPASVLS